MNTSLAAPPPAGATLPSISVLVPTLNSARTLGACLQAIRAQDYPSALIEIIVADGGSHDATLAIAAEYGASVVANPLVTGEAGKAAALRAANHEIVALIDSDNIIIGTDWLRRMVEPIALDPRIVGSEPLRFCSEREDNVIDRYCALAGANDPLCLFIGNYDRQSAITGRWTNLRIEGLVRNERYMTFDLSPSRPLPTIGANGTLYRRSALAGLVGNYLMDIDLPLAIAHVAPHARFAKVECGIRHLYCRDYAAFIRKQQRRIRDFGAPRQKEIARLYPWKALAFAGVGRFAFACLTVVPLVAQSIAAYRRTKDRAAFFHPIACWTTLAVYGWNVLFGRGKEVDRTSWRQ